MTDLTVETEVDGEMRGARGARCEVRDARWAMCWCQSIVRRANMILHCLPVCLCL